MKHFLSYSCLFLLSANIYTPMIAMDPPPLARVDELARAARNIGRIKEQAKKAHTPEFENNVNEVLTMDSSYWLPTFKDIVDYFITSRHASIKKRIASVAKHLLPCVSKIKDSDIQAFMRLFAANEIFKEVTSVKTILNELLKREKAQLEGIKRLVTKEYNQWLAEVDTIINEEDDEDLTKKKIGIIGEALLPKIMRLRSSDVDSWITWFEKHKNKNWEIVEKTLEALSTKKRQLQTLELTNSSKKLDLQREAMQGPSDFAKFVWRTLEKDQKNWLSIFSDALKAETDLIEVKRRITIIARELLSSINELENERLNDFINFFEQQESFKTIESVKKTLDVLGKRQKQFASTPSGDDVKPVEGPLPPQHTDSLSDIDSTKEDADRKAQQEEKAAFEKFVSATFTVNQESWLGMFYDILKGQIDPDKARQKIAIIAEALLPRIIELENARLNDYIAFFEQEDSFKIIESVKKALQALHHRVVQDEQHQLEIIKNFVEGIFRTEQSKWLPQLADIIRGKDDLVITRQMAIIAKVLLPRIAELENVRLNDYIAFFGQQESFKTIESVKEALDILSKRQKQSTSTPPPPPARDDISPSENTLPPIPPRSDSLRNLKVAKEEAELKAQQEAKEMADSNARLEAMQKADAERKAKAEKARLAKEEARLAKVAADLKAQQEAIQKADAERKAKEEARLAKVAADLKAQQEAVQKADAELKAKEEEARLAKEAADLKAQQEAIQKAEAERKAKEEARLAKEAADFKAQQEAMQKTDAERKAKEEARLAKEAADLKAQQEAMQKADAERKAKEEARLAKEAADFKAQQEAIQKAEAERKAKEEARLAKEAADFKAQQEAMQKTDAELKAKEEEARLAKEAADLKAQQEAIQKAEAERKAKEDARLAKEAADLKAQQEAKAKEDAEVKAKKEQLTLPAQAAPAIVRQPISPAQPAAQPNINERLTACEDNVKKIDLRIDGLERNFTNLVFVPKWLKAAEKHRQQQNYVEAYTALRKIIEQKTDPIAARAAEVLKTQFEAEEQAMKTESVALLQRAINSKGLRTASNSPADPVLHASACVRLAETQYAQGNMSEAFKNYEIAAKTKENPVAQIAACERLGYYYYTIGDLNSARVKYRTVIDNYLESDVEAQRNAVADKNLRLRIYAWLGTIYYKQGNNNEAKKYLQKALAEIQEIPSGNKVDKEALAMVHAYLGAIFLDEQNPKASEFLQAAHEQLDSMDARRKVHEIFEKACAGRSTGCIII